MGSSVGSPPAGGSQAVGREFRASFPAQRLRFDLRLPLTKLYAAIIKKECNYKNMKTSLVLTILLFINSHAGDGFRTKPTFPFSVDLETMDGQIINSSIFTSERKILIIDFWNIRCAPCIETFNSIRDNFHNWNLKTDRK